MQSEEVEKNWSVVITDEGQPFDFRGHKLEGQMMPIELHVKPDGDKDNNPSYAFLLVDAHGNKYAAQISNRMLQAGLDKANEMLGK